MRDRMEEHRKNPACAGCHKLMDPIGLALENFDGIGRWRDDRRRRADRCVEHALGRHAGQRTGRPAAGIAEPSRQFARTATEMLLTYALGRGLEYYDMPVVRAIVKDAAAAATTGSRRSCRDRQKRAVSDEDARSRVTSSMEVHRRQRMFLTKKHISRRTFLRSSVGVTLALPLLDAMVPAQTPLAKTAAAPLQRFGFIYVPHGSIMKEWTPAQEGAGFEFSPILKPLEPFRDRT